MSKYFAPFFFLFFMAGFPTKLANPVLPSTEHEPKVTSVKSKKRAIKKFRAVSSSPTNEKFETPFGQPATETIAEAETDLFLPIVINKRRTGEDQVRIRTTEAGEIQLDQINSDIFFSHLQEVVSPDIIDLLKKKLTSRFLTQSDLEEAEIQATYDIGNGAISMTVPQEWIKTSVLDLEFYRDSSMAPNQLPDFLSGYLNFRANYRSVQADPESPFVDGSIYSYTGVVHSLGATLKAGAISDNGKTRRTESSLTIPWNEGLNMIVLGDDVYSNITAINSPELSGFHFFQKATAKKHHFETDGGFIELAHRSTINIYRNNQLFRVLKADAGKFYISNLPLQLGQNTIRIVIKDEITNIESEKIIEDYLPLYGVPKGETEIAVAQGHLRQETIDGLNYVGEPVTYFGFMHGLSTILNAGASGYVQDKYRRFGTDERILTRFGNFSFQFKSSETVGRSWGTSGGGSFSGNITGQNIIRNYTISHERAGAGYEPSPDSKNLGYASSRLNLGLSPFKSISASMTYENKAEEGAIDDSFFVSLNRPFRISRNWAGGVALSKVWGTDKGDDTRITLSLTFSEDIGSSRFTAGAENNRDGTKTVSRIAGRSAVDYSATYIKSENQTDTADLSLEKQLSKAKLVGRVSAQDSGLRRGGEMQGETAIAFTNHAWSFSRPLSESFVIFQSRADRGAEFEVLDRSAKPIADNGSLWNSVVIPVRNFDTTVLTAGYTDPSYFTMDSSKNIIYRSGYRTGTSKYLDSDDRIVVMLRIVDENNEAVANTLGKIACENQADAFYDTIFTNATGETEFYAKRGASCKIIFETYSTETLDLNWPSKYRDFGTIPIKPN